MIFLAYIGVAYGYNSRIFIDVIKDILVEHQNTTVCYLTTEHALLTCIMIIGTLTAWHTGVMYISR